MIKGETVVVNRPIRTYDDRKDIAEEWEHEPVDNVLFGYPSTSDAEQVMRMYGTTAGYKLGIPKAYTKPLKGCTVVRMRDAGQEHPPIYRVLGDPQPLPPEICPTPWNRECFVEVADG